MTSVNIVPAGEIKMVEETCNSNEKQFEASRKLSVDGTVK